VSKRTIAALGGPGGGWLVGLGLCVLAAGFEQGIAATWTGTLHDGTVLQVDPDTRRPMRYYNGGVAPLWDGAHQLEDGSVVIVREGEIVPTEGMLDTWKTQPGAEPTMRERYCEQLVRKVCGFNEECGASHTCSLARQLQRIEREEQRRAPMGSGPHPQTASTGECLNALTNSAFPACKAAVPERKETACKKLVDRVCGKEYRCASSRACDAARQLLQMETEERLESADPDARTAMGAQCERASGNPYFKPCEP
jgi:hypothetical protein